MAPQEATGSPLHLPPLQRRHHRLCVHSDSPWQVPQLPPGLSYHVGANCVEGPKAVGAAKDVKISWEQPCSPHPTGEDAETRGRRWTA